MIPSLNLYLKDIIDISKIGIWGRLCVITACESCDFNVY